MLIAAAKLALPYAHSQHANYNSTLSHACHRSRSCGIADERWMLVLLVIIALLAVTVRVSELKQDLGEITGALTPQVRAQQRC